MATNVDQLRAGLSEYQKSLENHVRQLEQDFAELQPLWVGLRSEYEGASAEELLIAWAETSRWFEEYMQNTRHLSRFLEERISHLNTL